MSIKLAKFLLTDFIENNEKDSVVEFFRRSPHAYLIMLLIYCNQVENNELSFSDIYKKIPDRIASQLTIHNLINDAVDAGFLNKRTMSKDSRAVSLTLSEKSFKSVKMWLDHLQDAIN